MASKSTIIAISTVAAIAVGIVTIVVAIGFTPSSVPEQNGADAQSNNTTTAQTEGTGISRSVTYLSTQTVLVPPKDSADAEALCRDRDVVLSGGYTIGVFNSTDLSSLSGNAILYSNTAVRLMNATTIHEGWHAGLVNTGTENLTITANAICIDVTRDG